MLYSSAKDNPDPGQSRVFIAQRRTHQAVRRIVERPKVDSTRRA